MYMKNEYIFDSFIWRSFMILSNAFKWETLLENKLLITRWTNYPFSGKLKTDLKLFQCEYTNYIMITFWKYLVSVVLYSSSMKYTIF